MAWVLEGRRKNSWIFFFFFDLIMLAPADVSEVLEPENGILDRVLMHACFHSEMG